CADSRSTPISTSLCFVTTAASTAASRSKPYLGSPRASDRRAIGTSSAVTTRAREAPRCGASHGGARRRTEFGRTLSDLGDDPFRPRWTPDLEEPGTTAQASVGTYPLVSNNQSIG